MIGGVFHAQTAAARRPRFPRGSSSRRRAGRTRSRKYSLFVAERNSDYAICTTQATKKRLLQPRSGADQGLQQWRFQVLCCA